MSAHDKADPERIAELETDLGIPLSEPPPAVTGPWAKDIEATFDDPATRAKVDAFLRGHVQPYVTNLETKTKELEPAGQLIEDFRTDPAGTYLAITQELYGQDAEAQVRAALEQLQNGGPDPVTAAQVAADATADAQHTQLDPRVQELIDAFEMEKHTIEYNRVLDEVIANDPALTEADREWMHPFVVSSEGDMLTAAQGYKSYRDAIGGTPTTPAVEAPPVLGSDAVGGTPPPIAEKFESLDDAMNAFFAEQKAGAPSPVGTI